MAFFAPKSKSTRQKQEPSLWEALRKRSRHMPARRPKTKQKNFRKRALVTLGPALLVLGLDFAFRGNVIVHFQFLAQATSSLTEAIRGAHSLAYTTSALVSALLWGSLLVLATSQKRAIRYGASALFVTLFPLCLSVQTAFRTRWNIYLSRDATELSSHSFISLLGSLRFQFSYVFLFFAFLTYAILLLWLARKTIWVTRSRRRWATAIAAFAIVYALFVPVSYRQFQATTPDLLWINAASIRARTDRSAAEASMQIREPEKLEPIVASPQKPRNVVLILQESVRADVVCIEHDPNCELATQATNKITKDRYPFLHARSNASATAIAMSVLFTGLDPTAPKERLLRSPTLWEFAHAAGWDTAYFGSQHLIFANMWLWVADIPSEKVFWGTNLDTQADMFTGAPDELLAKRLAKEISSLREPFFLVIHPSNVHTPRTGERITGPFVPSRDDKGDGEAYRNAYKNAVFRSDIAVASMINALRLAPSGSRTVVVYTSDHGEAVWEHGQGCDHGCSVFEEEIRVPLWIDAPQGTLSEGEQQALVDAKNKPVFHVDVAATLLDLMGLWDAEALASRRRFFLGQPLTRPNREERTIPLSNVSHSWERGLPSYGLMAGSMKLSGMFRHGGFLCFDLQQDPHEEHDLPEGCATLRSQAAQVFGVPPGLFDKLATTPTFKAFVP